MLVIVGASFTAVTVRTNVSVELSVPSLAVTVIFGAPFALEEGVIVPRHVADPLEYADTVDQTTDAFATIDVSLELMVSIVAQLKVVSTSDIVMSTAFAVSSLVEVSAMAVIAGASLIATTVRANVSEAVAEPSSAVIVILALPLALDEGAIAARQVAEPEA